MSEQQVADRTRPSPADPPERSSGGSWSVVAGQELRDLWLSGRGAALMLAHTTLLSVSTYLIASNQELNFLEQREAVSLLLKIAVAVGGLLVVLAAADAVSGERERGTLESLLLTPVPRRHLLLGKGAAALSLWLGAFAVSLPYVWWIGRDVGTFGSAVAAGLLVGTLLALVLTGLGLVISLLSSSNAFSLAVSFFGLLALFAPHQLPAEATRGWAGELFLRVDPFTAGLLYLERVVLLGHSLGQDRALLTVPALAAALVPLAALGLSGRLGLLPGWSR